MRFLKKILSLLIIASPKKGVSAVAQKKKVNLVKITKEEVERDRCKQYEYSA